MTHHPSSSHTAEPPTHSVLTLLLCHGFGPSVEARALLASGAVTRVDEGRSLRAEDHVPAEALRVQGRKLPDSPEARLVLMHKPVRHLCARIDPEGGRPSLGPYLHPSWSDCRHIGRLDYNTSGLLLWTNVPALQRALLDPQGEVQKVYRVKVRGRWPEDDPRLSVLAGGTLLLDGEPVRPCTVRWLALRTRATWLEFALTEGRFRQIRRMCQAVGFQIVKLERHSIGPLRLPENLRPRMAREATPTERTALLMHLTGSAWPSSASVLDIQTTLKHPPAGS